jgi:hypothetical protein
MADQRAAVKERPILMSAPMVLAILDGRKTQTRRVVKGRMLEIVAARMAGYPFDRIVCPYGLPGDRLWVKESFRLRADQDHISPSQDPWKSRVWCEATGNGEVPSGCGGGIGRLRSSIHMPRWASRIDLEITEVRVQRLQDITEAEALAEGLLPHGKLGALSAQDHFQLLWYEINGEASWQLNPWVWALTFRRVKP